MLYFASPNFGFRSDPVFECLQFCTSSCRRGGSGCPAFPAPQTAEERAGPGAWLAVAERCLAAIHVTSCCLTSPLSCSPPGNHTTSWSTTNKGCKVFKDVKSSILTARRGEKSICLGAASPRWLLGPSCSAWDSSGRAVPLRSPEALTSSLGKA